MIWILLLILCLVAVIAIKHWISNAYYRYQNAWLSDNFSRCNCIVFGKKGTGKDLIFAHVIFLRNEKHYANMPYNNNTKVIDLKTVSVGENTFKDVIEGSIKKIPPAFDLGADVYISDGGIYLPCQYNNDLNQRYKSMPLLYALSRQLYQNNIHCNVQSLNRIWDKLREQADSFIRTLETVEHKNYLLVRTITYCEYNSAEKMLLPCKNRQYRATNGDINYRTFKIYKSELQYDTFYFRSVFIEDEKEENPLKGGFKNV